MRLKLYQIHELPNNITNNYGFSVEIYYITIVYMDRQLKNILIINIVVLLYWISTLVYRELNKKDIEILRKNIIYTCNGWCVSHFIHYLFLGYFAPKYLPYMIIQGVLFELLEKLFSFHEYIESNIIKDTLVNILGLSVGLLFFNIFPHKINLVKVIL